jgi:putative tricarboxylic transport membrane protein
MAAGVAIMVSSFKLRLDTLAHPGPGFLPFLAGLILFALSVVVFLRAAPDPKRGKTRQLWEGLDWPKAAIVAAVLMVYPLIFTHLGFLLSTILLLIFLLRAIEPVGWVSALGGAVLTAFVSFAVFALWLQVQLPRGIIENLFF